MPKKESGAAPAARTPATRRPPVRRPTEPQEDTLPEEGAGPHDDDEDLTAPIVDDEPEALIAEADKLFALWWGPPGSGKTTAAAQVLRAEPVGDLLICAAEPGLKVAALRSQGVDTDRIQVWPKRGQRPTFDALERLVMRVEVQLTDALRAGKPKPWCAIDIDSATELVQLMLDNVVEENFTSQRELARQARERGVAQATRRGQSKARFTTQRDDYGLVARQMRAIIRRLRYMDLHVLVTALVRRDEDADTGRVFYGPATPPALQQDLLGYADIVIRTAIEQTESGDPLFVGYPIGDESHAGKDRYNVLPDELRERFGADLLLERIRSVVVDSPDAPADEPPTREEIGEALDHSGDPDTHVDSGSPEADDEPAPAAEEKPKTRTPVRRNARKAPATAGK